MNRLAIIVTGLILVVPLGPALGQSLNARRTAMGGVVLGMGGLGTDAANVAYRAVPAGKGTASGVPLPIGLIPLIANPPVLDPDDPEFNIYKLANTLYNPPWNLQLVSPEPPSNDVVVELGKNHLSVQLGDVAQLFPDEHSRFGAVTSTPALGFGIGPIYAGVGAMVDYDNDLSLNDALHAALANGEDFRTNTEYALLDNGHGQAAAMFQLGWAGALAKAGDPRAAGGFGLYAGARTRLLRGLAYGEAQNVVAFTTRDTLFSSAPIDLQYSGAIRDAGPSGGGWGRGLDLGVVWLTHGTEIGIGLNDIGTRLDWKVEESVVVRDTATGEYNRQVVAQDVAFTSRVPVTTTVNVCRQFGRLLVAADVVRTPRQTLAHMGVETWVGMLALRTGANLDADQQMQFAGGVGLRFGKLGADLALASHSRNLSRDRGLELGAGLSLYH